MEDQNLISRRRFLQTTAASLGAFALGSADLRAQQNSGTRPNILLIMPDQWRYFSMSHARNRDGNVLTPNLDTLASQGTSFPRAYATTPLCTPNRAVLLTGRLPHETGVIGNSIMLPPGEYTMSQALADTGYRTHYIGKWHLDGRSGSQYIPPGWRRRGFQTFQGFNTSHRYFDEVMRDDDGSIIPFREVAYEPSLQTDLAIEFMAAAQEPFFCQLCWGPPHDPYRPPENFDRFVAEELTPRPNQVFRPPFSTDMAQYFGLCESLDFEMGRLMSALDELGLSENTIVLFTSDHGDSLGSHLLRFKNSPQEESTHIPMIMRWPGRFTAGAENETIMSTLDIMPTLLSLCGVSMPDWLRGRDLSAALMSGDVMADPVIIGSENLWRGIVHDRYKLALGSIHQPTHLCDEPKFYDLVEDPYEMHNLYGDLGYARPRRQMTELLNQVIWSTRDPFPHQAVQALDFYES